MASDTGGRVLLVMGVFRMTYDDLIRHLRFMVLDRYNCNEEAKDKLMKTAAYAIEELQIDALRYRWLRESSNQGYEIILQGEALDKHIDETMRESNK